MSWQKRLRRFAVFALVGLLAVAAAAASSLGARQDSSKVRIGLSGPTNTLDPATGQTASDYIPNILVSGQLYRWNRKRVPELDLLASSKVSKDERTVTQTLKLGLKYSDGTPVVAQDAVYSLERARKGPGGPFFRRVKSVTAPNDLTIVWKLTAPYPDFPDALSQQYILLHPWKQIEAKGAAEYFKKPVSAGPLVVTNWIPGGPSLMTTANPNYWRAPVVESVEFVAVQDLTSRALQLSQGALDFVADLPFAAKGTFPSEVRQFAQPQAGMFHITTNLSKTTGPLSDPRIRQVISLAMDRANVAEKAYAGLPKPGCSQLYAVEPYSCTLPFDGVQNLAAARALLKQTAYPKGFSFELQVWIRPGWPEAALLIAQDLAKIGITAQVSPIEAAVATANLASGNFEAQYSGNVGSPSFFLQNLYYPGTFWASAARFKDRQTVKLVDRGTLTPDPARRKRLFEAAERSAYKIMPHIPIVERVVFRGSRLPDSVLGSVTPGEVLIIGTRAR
jgi:peptide/nickel transport system substrate-binding protein